MDLTNTVKVVQEYGMEMVTELSAALLKQGSKHLYDQLDAQTVVDIESILLTIKGPQAIYYASEGRSGNNKYPPVQSMLDYVKSHNLQFRNLKGQYLKDTQTAFLVSRKIATLGSKAKASHFLDKWKVTKEFEDKAMQAFILDTKEELQKFIDQYESEQK
jgi:hypothetical protein